MKHASIHGNRHRWLKLFESARRDARLKRSYLAGPFLSYAPNGRVGILYVGKATGRAWHVRKFRGSIKERLRRTKEWIAEVETGEYPFAFWNFFRELSKHSRVIWTNVCKIGVQRGNPHGRYLEFQRKLAIETLRLEIKSYRPRLVIFATGDDYRELISEVVADKSWHRRSRMRWRNAEGNTPAILWIGHPQFKPRTLTRAWLRKAAELMS